MITPPPHVFWLFLQYYCSYYLHTYATTHSFTTDWLLTYAMELYGYCPLYWLLKALHLTANNCHIERKQTYTVLPFLRKHLQRAFSSGEQTFLKAYATNTDPIIKKVPRYSLGTCFTGSTAWTPKLSCIVRWNPWPTIPQSYQARRATSSSRVRLNSG